MVRPQTDRSNRARTRRHEKAARERGLAPKQPFSGTLEAYQVIIRPLVTEKGVHRSTRYQQYAFEVNKFATKIDVRKAVEELFNVKVVRVATQNRKGKPRRTRMRAGRTQDWKKAVVTLGGDDRIELF